MMKAYLILADRTIYEGVAVGFLGESVGEVVFNTSMTGYQEITTDPSYAGQIVNFTYPLLGNYGTNQDDNESQKPFLRGVIIKELEFFPSSFRNQNSYDEFLKSHKVVGISGIDTRKLTKHIRKYGVLSGAIVHAEHLSDEYLSETYSKIDAFSDQGLIEEVSTNEKYQFDSFESDHHDLPKSSIRLVAYDFGIKKSILRYLSEEGFDTTVVPYNTSFDDVMSLNPSAVFLSNGPGDPKSIPETIKTIRRIGETLPTMGICLGNQLLSLAFGGDTYKLKFGHRGANHPVKDLKSQRTYITTQNHGFAIDPDSLLNTDFELTHTNLNDQTVEGIQHKHLPIFSVQYHPEASAGPHDTRFHFKDFRAMVDRVNENK